MLLEPGCFEHFKLLSSYLVAGRGPHSSNLFNRWAPQISCIPSIEMSALRTGSMKLQALHPELLCQKF